MNTNEKKLNSLLSILQWTYGVVPIVAGLDKFFNLLTNWEQYLNPTLARFLPVSPSAFMHLVGIVEIAAGLVVLSRFTTVGAYVVSAWLTLIGLSLIFSGRYVDVGVRDWVWAVGAGAGGVWGGVLAKTRSQASPWEPLLAKPAS